VHFLCSKIPDYCALWGRDGSSRGSSICGWGASTRCRADEQALWPLQRTRADLLNLGGNLPTAAKSFTKDALDEAINAHINFPLPGISAICLAGQRQRIAPWFKKAALSIQILLITKDFDELKSP
jgi:hypothetical protein